MSDVTIYTGSKPSEANTKALLAYAAKEFGTKSPKFVVDDSLIAGIKIVGNNKQLELNLSDLLESLGQSLT